MKTTFLVGVAALLGASVAAQEIGYLETFSLADDRVTALKELVPGTDDYYYYHALQAQNTGQRARFQEVVDRWLRDRNGNVVDGLRELLNRQALLDYPADPKRTLEYLREQLDLHFDHARKTGEPRRDVPARLDPALLAADTLLERALAAEPGSVDKIEDAGLERAATRPLNGDQRRSLLARLRRPDCPGLVDHVLADLKHRDSRGFGSLGIHGRLTLELMEELLRKEPALRNQAAFVNSYLARLAPESEADLDTDIAAREAYLDRVWGFVTTLEPVHNSLKAHVLYHRLRHDQKRGVYKPDRFLDYLKLPRDVPYLRDDVRTRLPRGDHLARLDRGFGLISLPPIANEEPLLRQLLLYFLREAPSDEAYRPWLRDDFLKRIFAEAKIAGGVGDPQQWAPLLAPDEYRRLKERVDIEFAPDSPDVVGLDDPVRLTAWVKNVPVLRVKVYEINTFNYYRETGQPLNLALNLDGLVASSERRVEYPDPPERCVARTFEFPELKARGVYVVELIGNGRSSRALVQKGRLGVLQQVTAAGHAFTVLDEANRRLPEATAWLGGREFVAGPDGRILVPFSTAPRSEALVVRSEAFATLVRFEHLAESYDLRAGFYVDRESLIRRERAQVGVRPVLRVNGQPASLKLLEEPRLDIESVDSQGIVTHKEIPAPVLREDAETVADFVVPENAVNIAVTLRARVQNLSLNRKQDLAASAAFALNGIDRTPAVQDLHVSQAGAGYRVELRGKNGEPRPGESLACAFKHRFFRDRITTELQTDDQGRAWLDELAGVDEFWIKEPGGTEHRWRTAHGECAYPPAVQGRVGETLRIPVALDAAEPLAGVSLIEVRAGQFIRDWRSALGFAGGSIELRGLPAGDYSLAIKPANEEVAIRVTQGEDRDGFTLSARRALERPRLPGLAVAGVEVGDEAVEIRLAKTTPFTRVHVFATRYLPAYDVFERLGFAGAPAPLDQAWLPARTFYESGRDIGDEYRYILDRQSARKFPGNRLERPGLLLNPWAVRDTDTQEEVLARASAYGGRVADTAMAAGVAAAPEAAAGESPEGYAALDFLEQPAVVLWNLVPETDGRLRIPRAELKGNPHIRVLAVDPVATVLHQVLLPDTPVKTRDLRLLAGLDPARAYGERKLITAVPAKGSAAIADATAAGFETCDTLAKAHRLLATLAPNPTFDEFAFVTRWPDLDPAEQRRLYSKYACHELGFFLYHKDPEFFRSVIAPYLKNKKDKTFLDRWLLGEDLAPDLDPWRFARLNAAEQVLLGTRLTNQQASIARAVIERADLIAPNPEEFNRRFDTALRTRAMETATGVRSAIEDERRRLEAKARTALADRPVLGKELAVAPPAPAAVAPLPVAAAEVAAAVNRLAEAEGKPDSRRGQAAAAGKAAGAALRQRALRRESDDKAKAGRAEAEQLSEQLFFAQEKLGRAQARRFFQELGRTREWAENNYHHLPIERQLADLVEVNAFWADCARHQGPAPFLAGSFTEATRNFTEMMFALALVDLPFHARPHAEKLDGRQYTVEAGSPLLLFHREIRESPRAEAPGGVLVAQHFFRTDDRYRHEGNERFDQYVVDEFLPGVGYGAQVVLTNPTGNRQKLQVLLEIPRGALPVNDGFSTRSVYVQLEPYTTQTIEYFFYFPATGTFVHYPATVSRADRVIASAPPFVFHVVDRLTRIDPASWPWLSQNGTLDQVLEFLAAANLHRLDLDEIAWRLQDPDAFKKITARLESRHLYHHTLWSYAVRHNDSATLRTYLRHSPFADRCGLYLVSPLLSLDPVERLTYQHLEYAPLVNARAHPVGAKRKILNNRFREQYQRFLKVLSYRNALSDADALDAACYLLLQDRIEEALAWYARVHRQAVPEQLQCDYLEACLALYRGDLDAARRIAQARADTPVDRWRSRFAQILSQLDEVAGSAARASDPENRDQAQAALAASEPALTLQVEAGRIRLECRNLTNCVLNFYPMDVELLFSRSPFLQEGTAQFSFIRPVLSRRVELPPGQDTLTLDLPAEFRARNVVVEALAGGLRQAQAFYANTLNVKIVEAYGELIVTHAETRKPVSGAYVKVYAKTLGGEVRFFKDGYTDLRGRFDYASLSTRDMDQTDRLALLILSDTYGAVVRDTAPPKR